MLGLRLRDSLWIAKHIHLFFKLFYTSGLKLVHQLAENHSILEDLTEVSTRKRLSHNSLNPLKINNSLNIL